LQEEREKIEKREEERRRREEMERERIRKEEMEGDDDDSTHSNGASSSILPAKLQSVETVEAAEMETQPVSVTTDESVSLLDDSDNDEYDIPDADDNNDDLFLSESAAGKPATVLSFFQDYFTVTTIEGFKAPSTPGSLADSGKTAVSSTAESESGSLNALDEDTIHPFFLELHSYPNCPDYGRGLSDKKRKCSQVIQFNE
jgi:hypothetical protein